tara:strand:- start:594 stop:857 length:264 start_codon:yes stop_codon:yes gene_type:complete
VHRFGDTTYGNLTWIQAQFEYLQRNPRVEECAPESIQLLEQLRSESKLREKKLEKAYSYIQEALAKGSDVKPLLKRALALIGKIKNE